MEHHLDDKGVHRNNRVFCLCLLESTFYVVEGSCFEQSEPVLQRKPLHGSVGADHQPARTMNL